MFTKSGLTLKVFLKSSLQLITEELNKMRNILRARVLMRVSLFGLFGLAAFYLYLRWRFTSEKEMKCFIPSLLQADPVYLFAACR